MHGLRDRLVHLLDAELRREVLYFLGGFAPTEPWLADSLWKVASTSADGHRKRNSLVALFYSGPELARRTCENASVWDVVLGRLSFRRWRLINVDLKHFNAAALRFDDCQATDLHIIDSTFRTLDFDGGELAIELSNVAAGEVELSTGVASVALNSCEIGQLRARESSIDLSLMSTRLRDIAFKSSDGTIVLNSCEVGALAVDGTTIGATLNTVSMSTLAVNASWASMVGSLQVAELAVRDSLMHLEESGAVGALSISKGGLLTSSVVAARFRLASVRYEDAVVLGAEVDLEFIRRGKFAGLSGIVVLAGLPDRHVSKLLALTPALLVCPPQVFGRLGVDEAVMEARGAWMKGREPGSDPLSSAVQSVSAYVAGLKAEEFIRPREWDAERH